MLRILTSSLSVLAILAATGAHAQSGLRLDDVHAMGAEDIVVTAPYARDRASVLAATSVLTANDIARALQPQIGDVLTRQAGVSATSFGPGASRPVLRGFQGDRIRVLTDGIGSIDASNTSADHAVAIDPITAERIEVLRGPASLLYGSSAIGGVVNVFDRRIPRAVPDHDVHLDAIAAYGSAADERSMAAGLDAALSDRLVVHADGSWRKSDDLRIGGAVLSPALRAAALTAGHDEEAEAKGRLVNSATRSRTAGVGLSFIDSGGSLGIGFSYYDSLYGIPNRPDLAAEAEEGEHEYEDGHDLDHGHEHGDVRIDLRQYRLDLRGEVRTTGFFEALRVRAGVADYRHVEWEGDERGTVFDSEGLEARLELVQARRGVWRGAIGAQYTARRLEAVGEEAFIPRNNTAQFGLFTLQEADFGNVAIEASARFEHSNVRAAGQKSRSFNAFSAAFGGSVSLEKDWRAGINLSRAVRAPTAEELYSDGAHAATQAYELGKSDLGTERSIGIEAFVRADHSAYQMELTGYWSRFDDYIYAAASGTDVDGLPLFAYAQGDATYWGLEFEARAKLAEIGGMALHADAVADMVRARIESRGPAPRIPAHRLLLGLEASHAAFDMRVETEFVARQKRVSAHELPTRSFAAVNASVAYRPFAGQRDVVLMFSANNIFDVDVRRHASFLKDFAPLAGRDLRLTLRASF